LAAHADAADEAGARSVDLTFQACAFRNRV
jgi:hypothetical protein